MKNNGNRELVRYSIVLSRHGALFYDLQYQYNSIIDNTNEAAGCFLMQLCSGRRFCMYTVCQRDSMIADEI